MRSIITITQSTQLAHTRDQSHLFVGDELRHVVERNDDELGAVLDDAERRTGNGKTSTLDGFLETGDAVHRLHSNADDAAPVAEQLGDAGDVLRVEALHDRLQHLDIGERNVSDGAKVPRVVAVLA